MRSELLPLVNVVTPNASELAVLTGMPCQDSEEIGDAARSLASLHSGLSVIATGGDRPEPDDLVVHRGTATVLRGHRIDTRATHGTGCAFSSAVLCRLQSGEQMVKAAAGAKRYVEQAMRSARPRGSGHGPMNLLWPVTRRTED